MISAFKKSMDSCFCSSVLITGHRGMGHPLVCLEGELQHDSQNSIYAFRKAIRAGVSAIECDIQTSKDFMPMVIHNAKVEHHANYIGGGDLGQKCYVSQFNCSELQSLFVLKSIPWDPSQADNSDRGFELLLQQPERCRIPTLYDLLELFFDENRRRNTENTSPLLLNIDLKSLSSGIASLKALEDVLRARLELCDGTDYASFLKSIVFVGKLETAEITIVNSIIKYPRESLLNNPMLSRYYAQKGFILAFISRIELLDSAGQCSPCTVFVTADGKAYLSDKKGRLYKGKGGVLKSHTISSPQELHLEQYIDDRDLTCSIKLMELSAAAVAVLLDTVANICPSFEFIPQVYSLGQARSRVIEFFKFRNRRMQHYSSITDESLLSYFQDLSIKLRGVRTNIALSKKDIYVDPEAHELQVSATGRNLIHFCYEFGFDGIDASVHDFSEELLTCIREASCQRKLPDQLINGASFCKWASALDRLQIETAQRKALTAAARMVQITGSPLLLKVKDPMAIIELLECMN